MHYRQSLVLPSGCGEMAAGLQRERAGIMMATRSDRLCCRPPTYLNHPQIDRPGLVDGRREEVKLELPKHLALINAAVIPGDVLDVDREILEVHAPGPLQAALPRTLHLPGEAIHVLEDLQGTRGLLYRCRQED